MSRKLLGNKIDEDIIVGDIISNGYYTYTCGNNLIVEKLSYNSFRLYSNTNNRWMGISFKVNYDANGIVDGNTYVLECDCEPLTYLPEAKIYYTDCGLVVSGTPINTSLSSSIHIRTSFKKNNVKSSIIEFYLNTSTATSGEMILRNLRIYKEV